MASTRPENDLVIDELVVEYNSGGYAARPIDHLDHRFADGTLNLLLGPSGCGKSTLLSCLAGILTPTSGQIRLAGQPITGLGGRDLTRYRRTTVGIVFQSFNLVASLTALENVELPMRGAGIGAREARRRAADLLAEVDLEHRARHHPPDLSGGQQQRVAIARALALDPPLVLADEPTAHLDYVQVESVLGLLRRLRKPGRIVLVATHDERLLPLADDVLELTPQFADPAGGPEEVRLGDGEVLFRQGSHGNRIYVVTSGRVAILKELADGSEEQVADVGPGEHFGELGPLFGVARAATARAVGPTRLTGYTVRQFTEHVGAESLHDLVTGDGPR